VEPRAQLLQLLLLVSGEHNRLRRSWLSGARRQASRAIGGAVLFVSRGSSREG
jgi:hypothetical protein